MCVNMCKIPTQDFFTNEFGLPLTMNPSNKLSLADTNSFSFQFSVHCLKVQKWPCSFSFQFTWQLTSMLCYVRANRWAFFCLSESSIILADHRSHIIVRPYLCRFWRHELRDDIWSGATSLGRGSSIQATLLSKPLWVLPKPPTWQPNTERLHLQNGCTIIHVSPFVSSGSMSTLSAPVCPKLQ